MDKTRAVAILNAVMKEIEIGELTYWIGSITANIAVAKAKETGEDLGDEMNTINNLIWDTQDEYLQWVRSQNPRRYPNGQANERTRKRLDRMFKKMGKQARRTSPTL